MASEQQDFMSAAGFDTLKYTKKLRAAGFTEEQAEAQAEALHAVVAHDLATKEDIERLRLATQQDIERLRVAQQHDIERLHTATLQDIERLRLEMKELESRIVLRLGALVVGATAVLAVLMRLL